MDLATVVDALRHRYGNPAPPPARDPFALVVWACCAYLVDDERRLETFRALKKEIGLDAASIANARDATLAKAIMRGGMQPAMRAKKLKEAARIALEIGKKKLRALVRDAPEQAHRALRKFPPSALRARTKSFSCAASNRRSRPTRTRCGCSCASVSAKRKKITG